MFMVLADMFTLNKPNILPFLYFQDAPRLPSRLNYPRPISEPPSPASSRAASPGMTNILPSHFVIILFKLKNF